MYICGQNFQNYHFEIDSAISLVWSYNAVAAWHFQSYQVDMTQIFWYLLTILFVYSKG